MLFDLRGRGRRRTVQGIYLGLAVLFGAGYIGFNVGSGTGSGGGLVDALNGNGSGGGGGVANQVKAAQKRAFGAPNDPAAWAQLTQVRYQVAVLGNNFSQQTESFTPQGKAALVPVKQAWDHYLSLNPPHPNLDVAKLMAQAFGTNALADATDGVRVGDILTAAEPTYTNFAVLAQFAYVAGQARKGQLAEDRALSLAPASLRTQLKSQIDQYKPPPAAGAPGASGAPAPKSGTSHRNGSTPARPGRPGTPHR